MKCPNCGRHMSAWSLGPPDHEPAWHCPGCEVTISDEEAEEMMENLQQQAEQATGFSTMAEIIPRAPIADAELPDRPTVAEVARWLRKSTNTIYGWARDGEIPCVRAGRSYIFDKAALLKWARPEEAA